MILKVLSQMADALDYTHARGVIHRDIKPANVMIDAAGNAKIMDFGIARISDTRTCTPTGMVMGTVEYMAPEQIRGETVDGRADQFALAAVAYQMLTGATLFGPNTVATLTYKIVNEAPPPPCTRNAALPRGVDAVVAKALAKTPSERFTNCREFALALAEAFSGAPTAALVPAPLVAQPTQPMNPAPGPTQPARRSRTAVLVAVAAVLGTAFIGQTASAAEYATVVSSTPVTVFTWNLRYSAFRIAPSSHTTIDATVSVPWMCEMSKHSIRRGSFSSVSASCNAAWIAFMFGCSTRKRWSYDCFAFRHDRSTNDRFSPRCGASTSIRCPVRSVSNSPSTARSAKSTGTKIVRGTYALPR